MFVKMLDGPFAGEMRDLRSDVALEFIRDKKAQRAFADPAPEAPPIAATVTAKPSVNRSRKNGAR